MWNCREQWKYHEIARTLVGSVSRWHYIFRRHVPQTPGENIINFLLSQSDAEWNGYEFFQQQSLDNMTNRGICQLLMKILSQQPNVVLEKNAMRQRPQYSMSCVHVLISTMKTHSTNMRKFNIVVCLTSLNYDWHVWYQSFANALRSCWDANVPNHKYELSLFMKNMTKNAESHHRFVHSIGIERGGKARSISPHIFLILNNLLCNVFLFSQPLTKKIICANSAT